jgi:hypothetical protein
MEESVTGEKPFAFSLFIYAFSLLVIDALRG